MIDLDKFVKAVREMREEQRAFFRNRRAEHLVKAKQLEINVDAMLEEIEEPSLFPFEEKKFDTP